MSTNIAVHSGHHIVSELQANRDAKMNSAPPAPGRRVSQFPPWVSPSLKKLPIGITERDSDSHPLPVVDSFEKANSIYNSKRVWRGEFSFPPPRPKSNGIPKKNTSMSPTSRATERIRRRSCSPNKLMERDTSVETRGTPNRKSQDDSLGSTVASRTALAPGKGNQSIPVDTQNARKSPKKRDLFPCRDSPRPQACSSDARRAELDFQWYGDLEGRGDAVSWRNLGPLERRHEESKLYEKMILATQHAHSKVRAEGAGGLSLRI